ncbi:hypothetical protein SKAU_G00186990 [Synaphobranchus kaupii]|uniref:Uncharacterized protein n=1 Tax=Synaphobranchus kaupii TaxID=118154 RepID=A0A9Q1FCP1_SYNKA|nr:hypothetical protein SKAU_G00186990 [Synaphobranchus kaupii]
MFMAYIVNKHQVSAPSSPPRVYTPLGRVPQRETYAVSNQRIGRLLHHPHTRAATAPPPSSLPSAWGAVVFEGGGAGRSLKGRRAGMAGTKVIPKNTRTRIHGAGQISAVRGSSAVAATRYAFHAGRLKVTQETTGSAELRPQGTLGRGSPGGRIRLPLDREALRHRD